MLLMPRDLTREFFFSSRQGNFILRFTNPPFVPLIQGLVHIRLLFVRDGELSGVVVLQSVQDLLASFTLIVFTQSVKMCPWHRTRIDIGNVIIDIGLLTLLLTGTLSSRTRTSSYWMVLWTLAMEAWHSWAIDQSGWAMVEHLSPNSSVNKCFLSGLGLSLLQGDMPDSSKAFTMLYAVFLLDLRSLMMSVWQWLASMVGSKNGFSPLLLHVYKWWRQYVWLTNCKFDA